MSKPTLFIPLGIIVQVDTQKSLKTFHLFFNAFVPNLNLEAYLPKLTQTFLDFNKGEFKKEQQDEQQAFADTLLNTIIVEIPESRHVECKSQWNQLWQSLWNAQCTVSAESADTLDILLSQEDIDLVIYSETNITHYQHILSEIKSKLKSDEIISKLKALHAQGKFLLSFEQKCLANDMLKNYVNNHPETDCYRIHSNPNNVQNETLRLSAQLKEKGIQEALPKCTPFMIENGVALTPDLVRIYLQNIEAQQDKSKFMAAAAPSKSPLLFRKEESARPAASSVVEVSEVKRITGLSAVDEGYEPSSEEEDAASNATLSKAKIERNPTKKYR